MKKPKACFLTDKDLEDIDIYRFFSCNKSDFANMVENNELFMELAKCDWCDNDEFVYDNVRKKLDSLAKLNHDIFHFSQLKVKIHLLKSEWLYLYSSRIGLPGVKKRVFPRPVLSYTSENWNEEWDNETLIELGMFPQKLVSYKERIRLRKLIELKDNSLEKIDYDFGGVVVRRENVFDRLHHLAEGNTKRWKYFSYDFYGNVYLDKNNNKLYYYTKNNVIFEINPITWYVDKKNKRLISKDAVLPECLKDDIIESINDLIDEIYEHSKKFSLVNNEKVNESIINESNSKTDDVKKILNQINILLNDYYGDFNVLEYVNNLVDEYNKKIKELNKAGKSPNLSLGETNRENLYATLIYDLETILDKLKKNSEMFKDYREMLDIIHNCQKNPDEMDKERDDISRDVYLIKTSIFTYLSDKNKEEKLEDILNEEEAFLLSELKKTLVFNKDEKDNDLLSLIELKKQFALKMNPLLKELDENVNRKSLIDEIKKYYVEFGKQKFNNEKKSSITFYLKELNKLLDKILSTGDKYDKEKANNIIKMNIDFNQPFDLILKNLTGRIIELNKIILDINERKDNEDDLINIDNRKIINK